MKEKKKSSGLKFNIILFIISVLVLVIQLVAYKIQFVSYNVCNYRNCVCDYHSIKYNYTPGTTHQVLSIIFLVLAIILIFSSILLIVKNFKNDSKPEKTFKIIFALFTIIVGGLTIFMYRLDTKYGTEVQGQQQVLKHHGPNAYIKETCDRGN